MNRIAAAELLMQPWFIMPEYALGYSHVIKSLLSGAPLTDIDMAHERAIRQPMFLSAGQPTVVGWNHSEAPKNSVAVLRMKGPVVKDSQFCGPTGTTDYAELLDAMRENPNIIGAVLRGESGGGAAYAVKPMADAMTNFKKEKGLVVLAEDIFCSAMYYIGSYGDEIMADNPKSIVGSIGCMYNLVDMQPAFEKKGVKFHDIYATQSTEKNKKYRDAMDGNYDAMRSDFIDPLCQDFIDDVKSNRDGKINTGKNKIFNGETYFASQAKDLGMIDHLGSLNDAVTRARDISASKKRTLISTSTNMKFPLLQSLAGKTEVSQEELTAVNAELAEAGITGFAIFNESVVTDAADVTAKLETATQEITSLKTEIGEVKGELTTAKASVVTLQQKLAKAPAAVAPATATTEVKTELTAGELQQKEIDDLPHNKAIASNPIFNKTIKN